MAEFSDNACLKITPEVIVMCVPKFHLWVHKPHCHAHFSFNYVPGASQTHEEMIEENWADSNKAMAQMKMIGPGAWQDTLDNIFGFYNYRVMANFDHMLANRLACAIKEACIYHNDFKRFNEGVVSYFSSILTSDWLKSIVLWEKDHSKPCLYEAMLQGKETLQEVELALAREEHENSAKASIVSVPLSLSSFLMTGIQLEEAQCTLELEVKVKSMGTVYQQLDIQRQRAALIHKINRFCGLQQVFMLKLRPVLSPSKLHHIDSPASFNTENIKLFIPLELDNGAQRTHICMLGVAATELHICEAEACDSLQKLCLGLWNRSTTHLFTVKNVISQNSTTQNQGILRTIQMNIHANKLRYHYAQYIVSS
ncbi:uncharacterized protein ARMOST_04652 [Armillaria ostoyae]|uniref:Uncharacterized protein n=1 Tax=Armillaria ostoyae TaxID=47428 RepID=A0A284QY61_ARMOS|nr:uncharacterized protein ARMOST_04652 [Armillaria ostoyae]